MHIATGSPLELMRLWCVFYSLGNILTRALVGSMLRSLFPVSNSDVFFSIKHNVVEPQLARHRPDIYLLPCTGDSRKSLFVTHSQPFALLLATSAFTLCGQPIGTPYPFTLVVEHTFPPKFVPIVYSRPA
jgi:hypothetical protein